MTVPRPSIQRALLQFALVLMLAALVPVGFLLFAHHVSHSGLRLKESTRATAQIIASNAAPALAFRDEAAAREILASLRHDPLVRAAALYDADGWAFVVHRREPGEPVPERRPTEMLPGQILAPVEDRGESYGSLYLVSDYKAELRQTVLTWAAFYVAAFAMAGGLAYVLARRLRREVALPLVELARAAAEIAAQPVGPAAQVQPRGPKEVARLAEAFNHMRGELASREAQLAGQLRSLDLAVREREAAQADLKENTRAMLRVSREAGMAEVATGVLHNIGNALNGINVSAELLGETLRNRAADTTGALRGLLVDATERVQPVFAAHPQGAVLHELLASLVKRAEAQMAEARQEIVSLRAGVAHLKEVVARQQALAAGPRPAELFDFREAVRDALLIDQTFGPPSPKLIGFEEGGPPALVHGDRAAVVQILINLVANARAALRLTPAPRLEICLRAAEGGQRALEVRDNGVGIPADQMVSIFSFGFTTKAGGHGFGLHYAANAARLMGGQLQVQSEGPGRGAVFILSLPLQAPNLPSSP
jgi:two-component system, NtrC family, sensor kinase